MGDYDFEVDFEAMVKLAQSAGETVKLMKDHKIDDVVPSLESLGHDDVKEATKVFRERWQLGVEHMTDDITEASNRIGQVAGKYYDYDQAADKIMKDAKTKVTGLKVLGGDGA